MEDKELIIVDLLQNSKADPVEREKLAVILQCEKETKRLLNSYEKISDAVKDAAHPSFQQLEDYILIKHNNFSNGVARTKHLIPKIENHLKFCKNCEEAYEMLNREYEEADSFVSSNFVRSEFVNSAVVRKVLEYIRNLFSN